MTQRERSLFLVVATLGGFVAVFGGFVFIKNLFDELDAKDRVIESVQSEVGMLELRLAAITGKGGTQQRLNRWKAICFGPDTAGAAARYGSFLKELARKHQLAVASVSESGNLRSGTVKSSNLITPMSFQLKVEGTLPRWLAFLREFYETNLPHLIREVELTSLGSGAEVRLEITAKVEALSLPNAVNRDYLAAAPDPVLLAEDVTAGLRRAPVGLGMLIWAVGPTGPLGGKKLASTVHPDRDYFRLVSKNVFAGLAAPAPAAPSADKDVLKYVQLTSITSNFITTEAWLRNRLTNRYTRLRAEGGLDSFEIRDANDQVVLKGKVMAVNAKNVVLLVGEKHYVVHAGQFLSQALEKSADEKELQALGVKFAAGPENP